MNDSNDFTLRSIRLVSCGDWACRRRIRIRHTFFILCGIFSYHSGVVPGFAQGQDGAQIAAVAVPLPRDQGCAQGGAVEQGGAGSNAAAAPLSQGRKTPIDVNADHVEMDWENKEVKATGDVRIAQSGFVELRADQALYRSASKQIEASGKIRLVHRGDVFTSERVVFDVAQQTGSFQDVTVNMRGPGGRATAKAAQFRHEIEGRDRDFITLEEASFSNCDCELGPGLSAPPWHFTAKSVEVDRADNSVTARNIRLYAGNVPVFAFPWWQQPLLPERKSGFLRPAFRISGNGFETEVPYYWNASENRDATLALRSISQRGLMTKLQYRYLGQDFKGQIDTNSIDDTVDGRYRGLMVLEHEHTLGNWQVRSHLEGSQTRNFINDFEQKLVDSRSRRMESTVTLDRLWMRGHGYTNVQSGVRWYQDLEKENDDLTVQNMPFISLTDSRVLSGEAGNGVTFDPGGNHWRLDSETRVDNFYQLLGGSSQRFDMAPTLYFDRPIYVGRVGAAFGVRETAYLPRRDPLQRGGEDPLTVHRESTLTALRVDGSLLKAYGDSFLHTLEPSVQYVLNTSTDQGGLPNYDASLRRLTITDIFAHNLYSGVDRVSEGQWVGYGLTSRVLNRAAENMILERGVLTLGQRWAPPGGARHYQDGQAFSNVVSSLEVKFSRQVSASTMVGYSPYRREVESVDTILSMDLTKEKRNALMRADGDRWGVVQGNRSESARTMRDGRVTLGHHFSNPDLSDNTSLLSQPSLSPLSLLGGLKESGREKVDDLSLDAAWRLSDNWTWKQKSDYSLEFSELKSWGTGLTYEHPCWDLTLTGGRELATTTNQHGGGFIGFFINLQGVGGVGI